METHIPQGPEGSPISDEPRVVRAPVVENGGRVIYQVTLARGLILTNPQDFGGLTDASERAPGPVLAEDGRVLAPSRAG